MCFKSSSTTKTVQDQNQQTTPRYGTSDAFNNFMTGYNAQYSPENFAATQQAANINPLTTEAAQRQSGLFPVLSSTLNDTSQVAREGLSQADINRYKNPYTDSVVNPMLTVFDQQNRAALNNIGGKFAQQGAFRNNNRNTAYNNYYEAMQPGQNLQVANLYNSMYDKAVQAAQANIQAKLQGAQTTNQLASGASAAAQTQFNMGDAMRNAGIQQSMIPYQLYNQGLSGQQTAGNMYGVESSGHMNGTSTTTNSPSLFDSALKLGSAVFGAVSGFPMGQAAGTSIQGPGGWQTTVNPASSNGGASSSSSWWPFADGGKVVARGRPPAKATGGGVGHSQGGTGPDAFAQKVMEHAANFSKFKSAQKKAIGGGIHKDVGGGLTDQGYSASPDDEYGRLNPFSRPLFYGPPEPMGPRIDEMAPPQAVASRALGEQYGPPAPGPQPIPPDYALDYSDHRGAGTADDPTTPPPFQPTPTPQQPAPVMRPYPEPTPPRPLSDPRSIKQGVYTPGGVMAEPGSWRAYGADLSSLFGTLSTGKDPMGSMADRHREGIQQIMNHEKDANEATRLYEDMKLRGIHFGNTDAVAAATAAREAERAPLVNLQTQVMTEAARQGIPTEAFNTRVAQAKVIGMEPKNPDGTDNLNYWDYVTDGKFSANKAGKQTEFDKDNEKAASKDLQERQASAINANAKIATIQRAQKIIENPNLYQGALGDWVLQAKKLGLLANMADPTGVAEGELLAKIGNEFALQARDTSNGTGMPGAMSDSDRKFLMATTLGIDKTPAGNRLMAKLALEQEVYKQRLNQEAIKYISAKKSNIGLPEYLADWMQKNNAHGEDTQREGAAILQKERGMSIDEAAASNAQGLKAQAAAATGKKVVTRYQNPSGQVMVWDTKKGTYQPEAPEVGTARERYEGGYGKNDYHQ